MPEGDTVRKIADFMAPRLAGKTLLRALAANSRLPLFEGNQVLKVAAAGKHLLVHLPDWVLRVHLGMHGSWHRYAPNEIWRRSPRSASVVLSTADDVFVCFSAKDVECLRSHEVRRSVVAALGPDLLATACDLDVVLQRARACPSETPLVDVLLDQRIAAGIGNVYKCELLFMHQYAPLTPLGELSDEAIRTLYVTARTSLQSNLGGWRRTTTYDARQGPQNRARLFVYGRAGTSCTRCGKTIIKAILGATRRVTHWCPGCQE